MVINHHITKLLASERVTDLRREAADRHHATIKPERMRGPLRARKRRRTFVPARSED